MDYGLICWAKHLVSLVPFDLVETGCCRSVVAQADRRKIT